MNLSDLGMRTVRPKTTKISDAPWWLPPPRARPKSPRTATVARSFGVQWPKRKEEPGGEVKTGGDRSLKRSKETTGWVFRCKRKGFKGHQRSPDVARTTHFNINDHTEKSEDVRKKTKSAVKKNTNTTCDEQKQSRQKSRQDVPAMKMPMRSPRKIVPCTFGSLMDIGVAVPVASPPISSVRRSSRPPVDQRRPSSRPTGAFARPSKPWTSGCGSTAGLAPSRTVPAARRWGRSWCTRTTAASRRSW